MVLVRNIVDTTLTLPFPLQHRWLEEAFWFISYQIPSILTDLPDRTLYQPTTQARNALQIVDFPTIYWGISSLMMMTRHQTFWWDRPPTHYYLLQTVIYWKFCLTGPVGGWRAQALPLHLPSCLNRCPYSIVVLLWWQLTCGHSPGMMKTTDFHCGGSVLSWPDGYALYLTQIPPSGGCYYLPHCLGTVNKPAGDIFQTPHSLWPCILHLKFPRPCSGITCDIYAVYSDYWKDAVTFSHPFTVIELLRPDWAILNTLQATEKWVPLLFLPLVTITTTTWLPMTFLPVEPGTGIIYSRTRWTNV